MALDRVKVSLERKIFGEAIYFFERNSLWNLWKFCKNSTRICFANTKVRYFSENNISQIFFNNKYVDDSIRIRENKIERDFEL